MTTTRPWFLTGPALAPADEPPALDCEECGAEESVGEDGFCSECGERQMTARERAADARDSDAQDRADDGDL